MYIKTYENQINSSPDLTPQNLAITTPQGLNLNRFLLRRSGSKTQKTSPLSPVKADPLMQILQTSPEAEIKIYPHFYQSNCFGITLKHNRIREIKARNRGIYELLRKGAGEEQQQIQQKLKEEQTVGFHNRDIRSLSKRRSKNKKKLAQFNVSGRPASRDSKYGQSFRQKVQKKQNNVHQTVLDFSKLAKQQQNSAYQSSSARPTKYTQIMFNPQKIDEKQVKTNIHHQLYRHKSNNHCDSHNINTRSKKWKYNSHYTQHQHQHQHQYLQFQNNFGLYDDQYMVTQPQILVDYRRSMSSGRKRAKAVSGEQDVQGQGGLTGADLVGPQGEKINAWAVKKLEQDQQLIF